MIAGIPRVQSALNFFMNAVLIVRAVPKSLNCPTLSKDLLLTFKVKVKGKVLPRTGHEGPEGE